MSENTKVLIDQYSAEVQKVLGKKLHPIKTQVELIKLQLKFFPENGKTAVDLLVQLERALESASLITPEERRKICCKGGKSDHKKK